MSTLTLRLLLALGRAPLAAALGFDESARVRRDAPVLFAALLRQLPDFGSHGGARAFVTGACWLIAFHRALPDRDAAANTELLRACLFHAARRVPGPIRRLYRWLFFLPAYHQRLFAATAGGGPEGFEGKLVRSDRHQFGVDYTRCGIQTFLLQVGATDLAPHVCSLDDVESEVFGLGLVRTGTLGRGAHACDFRWTRTPP